ncbi:NB-ARC domain-containing protein, partial [Frankia nepalensis]
MANDLSAAEASAFAEMFPDVMSAGAFLASVGLPRKSQPAWMTGTSAEDWWAEVARLLEAGKVDDGRRRLLAAAEKCYPAHPLFGGSGAGRQAVWVSSWERLRASRPLPAMFVPRDRVLDQAVALLAVEGAGAVGLVGAGGTGKSTLARAVLHDGRIGQRFTGGAVWVEVNPGADVREVQGRVLAAFGDSRPVTEVREGRERLRDLLAGTRRLVVLDDVWEAEVAEAFPQVTGMRLLVTSRSARLLHMDAPICPVGTVEETTARRLLAAYSRCAVEMLPPAATGILAHCAGLAVALAVAGSLVGELWEWEEVAEAFDAADLAGLTARFPDYPYPNLLVVLATSVRLLPEGAAARFQELAVFKGHGPVPVAVVVGLWQTCGGMSPAAARALLRQLDGVSLIQVDRQTRTVTAHDLLFDFARAELGVEAFTAAHGRVAGWLLDRWGGLTHGLPGLHGAAGFDEVDRYSLAWLVAHLLAADEPDRVDLLLATERLTAGGRVESVWCTAHEDQGGTASYLAQVRAAWDDARTRYPAGDPRSFARQAGYALLIGSITSMAANIPPALLVRLVETGTWPTARALAYAQAIPQPVTCAQALGGLAPHLPAEVRGPVLVQALAAATAIDSPYDRAAALSGLAPHLSADLLAQALAAAPAIDRPSARALALSGLAPHLPAEVRGPVLVQALAAATAIDWPSALAWALRGLAPHLPADLLAQALAAAIAIDSPGDRAWALRGLAPHLPADLLAQALAAAIAIDRSGDRAWALSGLAPHLPADLLTQVLAAATAIDRPDDRAWALSGLAPHLPTDLLTQVLAAATAIDRPSARALALSGLAPHLPAEVRGPVLVQALAAATAIDRASARASALRELAPHLPTEVRAPVLVQALAAATAIDSPDDRASALRGLAPHLPADLLTQALAAATAIDRPDDRAAALRGLAPHLPADLLTQALAAATAIDRPDDRAAALSALAPHLPADLLTQALAAATTIDRPDDLASALRGLAPHLPAEVRGPVLVQALAAAAAIDSPSALASALRELAPHLPADLLAQALAAATTIDSPGDRAWALRRLAPHLPADLLTQALAAATAIDRPDDRASALRELAPHLPTEVRAPVLVQALAAATAIDRPGDRAAALRGLAPHLPADLLAQALAAATAIDSPYDRASALRGLAPHLPADARGPVLVQALAAAAA